MNCSTLGTGLKRRGPFVVRQDGYAPGSMTFKEDRFLLRKDGTWVLNLIVFALPETEKEQFFFDTSAEAITLLDGLPGDPVVEETLPADKSIEELKRAAESTLTGLWGRIRSAKVSPP